MDEYVKQSIESRKNAIFAAYDVKGELLKKVEVLFAEMEKLGASCKDVGDFEAKLAASPLNQQYLDLFTEIAKKEVTKTTAKGAVVGIAQSAAEQALRKVVPTRAAVNQKATDAMRGVPVLGDAIDIGQKASYAAHLGGLFRRKKK
jgi:hypothetical protein